MKLLWHKYYLHGGIPPGYIPWPRIQIVTMAFQVPLILWIVLLFFFYFPTLLKYNWHITLCKFKVYNVMIWNIYTYSEKWKWSPSIMSDSCDPTDCILPGFSFHGIFQARVLEWVAISFSRGSSRPRDQTQVSLIADRHYTLWATREALSESHSGVSKFSRPEYWSG